MRIGRNVRQLGRAYVSDDDSWLEPHVIELEKCVCGLVHHVEIKLDNYSKLKITSEKKR